MNNEIIREIEKEQLKDNIPNFNVGDTVRVYAKVVEGSKERIQMFEGIVLKRQGGSLEFADDATLMRAMEGRQEI